MEDWVDEGGGWLARPQAIWQDQWVPYLLVQAYSNLSYCGVPPDISACQEHALHKLCVYCVAGVISTVTGTWIPYLKVGECVPSSRRCHHRHRTLWCPSSWAVILYLHSLWCPLPKMDTIPTLLLRMGRPPASGENGSCLRVDPTLIHRLLRDHLKHFLFCQQQKSEQSSNFFFYSWVYCDGWLIIW